MENKNNNSDTRDLHEGYFDQSFELGSIECVKDNPQEYV